MSNQAPKKNSANRSITQWLAHWQPTSVIAVDADGEEHPIVVSKTQKRRWDIVAKAILEVDAVTVRAMSDEGLLATRTLRTVDPAIDEAETSATPATAGGYDVTAVVQCVAREVREAIADDRKATREMLADVLKAHTQMLKDMSERHSASEKALLDAREQIMIEREERIAEREEAAERAAAEAEKAEEKQQAELVKSVLQMAMQNPEGVKNLIGGLNGKPKIAVTASPTPKVETPKAEG
jgi:23S rRNA pseudoU1915 N3-methylase RlmH